MPAGPLTEADLVVKRQAIPNEVFCVERHLTPKFSWLKKGTVGANMLGQVTMEKYAAYATTGILDGTAVTSSRKQVKESADVCAQHFRDPWAVTTLAEISETHGVADQVADARLWSMRRLKRMLEIHIGSNTDQASETGGTPWTMRGMLSWLQNGAQTTRPVPANFRPASASRYTGAMTAAAFTDSALAALFASAFGETNDPLDLDLFVGATCKRMISEMTQADPYRVEGNDEVKNKVMVVSFDAGYGRIHLDPFIAWDTTSGAATAYTPLSGVGINAKQWMLEHVQNKAPANTNLSPDGSGTRGFIDCVTRLWSKNPQGQISIYTATDA